MFSGCQVKRPAHYCRILQEMPEEPLSTGILGHHTGKNRADYDG